MDPFYVAIGIFVIGFFGARFIQESAFKELTTDQKGNLIEALSDVRKKTLYAVIIVVSAVLAALYFFEMKNTNVFIFYLVALTGLMLFTTVKTRQVLLYHQFPKAYITKYIWGACVRYFSIGVFLIVLLNSGKLTF